MKTMLWFIGLAALVLGIVRAEPDPAGSDVRKARHPASGPTNYNALSTQDSENLSKLQNQVAPSVQIALKPVGTTTKTSEASPSYSITSNHPPSSHLPTTSTQNLPGQYYISMTPHTPGNQVLGPATTPLIMQYINPQGQPTGGIQYIQLLRPLIYPYNTQYVQPNYIQQHQPSASINQHPHLHHPHSLPHYSAVPSPTSPPSLASTTQSSFVPFQPSSLPHYSTATTAGNHLQPQMTYSNPVGQYSSPVLSYYPSRFSLINTHGDMTLNTNEYMPSPGDHVYIKGVKTMRA
ncbi:uncharacterized protein LOC129778187 [Toxorhynchites rutilus septentrionalis]|uniref:uncharacterized protein LOC129778187 n=1 Tax=Toxorhynchites rutilus septentrionalis TaxID=329112 RepID=UPI002479CC1B|nr:uncharacterized protein LOC129778187 [Toxorhynchites rutilus septentrionalis]